MIMLEAIASGLGYSILALFVGALITAGFGLPQGEPAELRRRVLFLSLALLFAFLLVAVLSLVIQGAKLTGGSIPSFAILGRYLLRTQSGKIWLMREAYGGVLALGALWAFRSDNDARAARLLLLLSLPLVASRSLTSHAIAVKENTIFIVSADAIHLIATALWAGGLPVLFWILLQGLSRPSLPMSWAAEAVGRFSRLALTSVAVLVATGFYQSLIHVQNFSNLFGTPYGKVLCLKIGLFLAMLSLGALNFLSTRPRLRYADKGAPVLRMALKRIGTESLLGLLVLFVTGSLTVLPPGAHSGHLIAQRQISRASVGEQTGPRGIQGEPRRLDFFTRLGILLMGSNPLKPAEGASVKLLSPEPGQVFKGDEIPIRYEFVKGKRGNHLHAYVDGMLMGMFSHPGSGTLTGIKPGWHTLEVRVVAEDHTTELDAIDRVNFVVK